MIDFLKLKFEDFDYLLPICEYMCLENCNLLK